jgi:hypothetical protein
MAFDEEWVLMDVFVTMPDGDPLGIIDDYVSIDWKVRYTRHGSFNMTMPERPRLIEMARKNNLVVLEGEWYRIDQVEGKDDNTFVVSGMTPFPDRLILPPAADSHDKQLNVPAETAMKHYIENNVGASASAERQVSDFTYMPDQGRGGSIRNHARFHDLMETIEKIGADGGLGWMVYHENGEFIFDVFEADDRTDEVFFDVEFDSIEGQKFLSTLLGIKTFGYVAGQGEGVERAIREVYVADAEPEGWERREAFIDARDIEDDDELVPRGESKIRETAEEDVFEVDINVFGSFQYNRDWFLGDTVTLRSRLWEIARPASIVGIVNEIDTTSASVHRSVELDRVWPTLRDKVMRESERPGGSALA